MYLYMELPFVVFFVWLTRFGLCEGISKYKWATQSSLSNYSLVGGLKLWVLREGVFEWA